MKRRLLNLLTVVSLLLCVAVAVLWLRSEWVDPPDRLAFANSSFFLSSGGAVGWNHWSGGPPAPSADDGEFLGFGRYKAAVGNRTLTEWRVPYWFLALATAAAPAAWLVGFGRRRGRDRDRGFEVTPPERGRDAGGQ